MRNISAPSRSSPLHSRKSRSKFAICSAPKSARLKNPSAANSAAAPRCPISAIPMRERFRIEVLGDARIGCNTVTETGVCLPGRHGAFLHRLVGVIPGHSFLHQILQQLSRVNQAVGGFEVSNHSFRENTHLAEDGGHFGGERN